MGGVCLGYYQQGGKQEVSVSAHCTHSALLLYWNTSIDVPEVLINNKANSFLSPMDFVSFLAFNRICWGFSGRAQRQEQS